MRIDPGFLEALREVHDPPGREFALVTHFEHPYEISPDAAASVRSVRSLGVSVYNQQVFTMENCRRFETVALRSERLHNGADARNLLIAGIQLPIFSLSNDAQILEAQAPELRIRYFS
ncbi:MAG: hypothetical protein BWY83_02633 [bacterium ADurb.Bin478]|nr:MAG: hypothetical protein BWY83_02633 [bacterium ADurb.Bin478]